MFVGLLSRLSIPSLLIAIITIVVMFAQVAEAGKVRIKDICRPCSQVIIHVPVWSDFT